MSKSFQNTQQVDIMLIIKNTTIDDIKMLNTRFEKITCNQAFSYTSEGKNIFFLIVEMQMQELVISKIFMYFLDKLF